jgi:hypothetical protein
MNKIQLAKNIGKDAIALKDTKAGDVIRFSFDALEEAIQESNLYLRIDAPEAKDRVRLVNLSDGKQLERDGDHRVFVHKIAIYISP